MDYSGLAPEIAGLGEAAFCEWLTRAVGVAAIPLSAFYPDGRDQQIARLCFAKRDETLTRALERLRQRLGYIPSPSQPFADEMNERSFFLIVPESSAMPTSLPAELITTRHDSTLVLTLSDPASRNALSPDGLRGSPRRPRRGSP